MAYWGDKRRQYQRDYVSQRRTAWISDNGPCKICGSNESLEIDHIIPRADKYSLKSSNIWHRCIERREEELKLCQVLCKKCHSKKSAAESKRRYEGKTRPHLRKVSDSQILEVLALIKKDDLSERDACSIVGISRSTFSVIKLKYRQYLFKDRG